MTTLQRLDVNMEIKILLEDIYVLEQGIEREKIDAVRFKKNGLHDLETTCYERMNKKSREIIEIGQKIETLKKDL